MQPIGFLEERQSLLEIERLLDEPFGIPFAAWEGKEIATVDMHRPRQATNRIQNRVDDVMTEGDGITLAQGFRASGFDSAIAAFRHASPEDIVLTTGVNTDDGSHLMVVRQLTHPWSPDDIQDSQFGCSEERVQAGPARLTKSP